MRETANLSSGRAPRSSVDPEIAIILDPMEQLRDPQRPRKGDRLEVSVDSLAFGGKGVARLDNLVVFVNGGVPGDVAQVLVHRSKKRYAEARVLNLVEPSPDRVEPRCPAFGTCGGCVWQNLDYDVQLAFKRQQVRESLEHLGGLRDVEVRPILGMADPWRYRNRVDFSIGRSPEGAVVGFRPAGRWDTVLPLSKCHLVSEEMEGVRASVERWLRAREISGWNPRTAEGFARHLVVRSARGGSELLVSLVTRPGDLPDEAGLVETLRSSHPRIVGIAHSVNEGRAELSAGLESRMIWGRPYLLESLRGITLRVSLDAFFQTNTEMAHMLFGVVAEEALQPSPRAVIGSADDSAATRDVGPVIWDLYSGVGSIGLSLADRARAVLGIESGSAAVSDARRNADFNKIQNSWFLEGDVRRVLRELAQADRQLPVGLERPDVVIVDPPRSGLHKRVVCRIGETAVPRIVYVSCNPATMAPNLAQFQEHGYRLERVTPVDMFPHTPHVEAVGLLVRKG